MKFPLILGGVMAAGIVFLLTAQLSLSQKIDEANEKARPANISTITMRPLDCADCFDPSVILSALAEQPVIFTNQETVAYPSERAQELIDAYGITALPALILTGETDKPNIADTLSGQTRSANDGHVWANMPPPTLDLITGEVLGRVEIMLLTDPSCADCYDVRVHEAILKRSFGMAIASTRTIERASSEGRDLMARYDITALPTAILSQNASLYSTFVGAWKSVGSTEEDGAFVFRNLAVLGAYLDLKTGDLVRPNTQ